jgi:hypothetical protein
MNFREQCEGGYKCQNTDMKDLAVSAEEDGVEEDGVEVVGEEVGVVARLLREELDSQCLAVVLAWVDLVRV